MDRLRHTRSLLMTGYRYLRMGRRGDQPVDVEARETAIAKLMQVYAERPDLKEVYPEAASGDLARLTSWAGAVSCGSFKDSSHDVLRPYASVYRMLPSLPPEMTPPPWARVAETSRASANPLAITVRTMEERAASSLSNHLMTLSLLVREFGLKRVVELGTDNGNSTLALLEAARAVGGHVISVDIEPCLPAKRKIEAAGFLQNWTFIQGDDLALEPPQIPAAIDLLFIDTNHLYAATLTELNKYSRYLRPGAWIALHDYVSFPGVNRAIQEFVKSAAVPVRFYAFVHQNGLALLRWHD